MHENADCDWFECIERKFWNFKESMLHLLIGMNPDFDDDLLQETIEILDLWTILEMETHCFNDHSIGVQNWREVQN